MKARIKTNIRFNGREYANADEMPSDVRAAYDRAVDDLGILHSGARLAAKLNAKIIVNDRSFEGVGTRTAPHQQHGDFDPTNNNGYAALQAFYTSTMNAKLAAPGGVCGPSQLTN